MTLHLIFFLLFESFETDACLPGHDRRGYLSGEEELELVEEFSVRDSGSTECLLTSQEEDILHEASVLGGWGYTPDEDWGD